MEQLILKLKQSNIDINVVDNQIELNIPEGFDAAKLVEEVKLNKRELVEYIRDFTSKARFDEILPANAKKYYQLSSTQRRLYFLYQMDKRSTAYNMPQTVRIEGNIDSVRLEEVIKKLIDRHESLRTYFELVNGEPVQKILDVPDFHVSYCEGPVSDVEAIISEFIQPFDLSVAPLLRVQLFEMSSTSHILMVDMHHIVSDGISQSILIKDFMSLYNGEKLSVPRLQYKDYAEWQQGEGHSKRLEAPRKFWMREFSDEVTPLLLPTDFPRPRVKNHSGNTLEFVVSEQNTAGLKKLAEESGATMFASVFAIFNVLLSKICNQEDIVVGTSTAGRSHAGIENVIGMFVNALAVRTYPKGDLSFNQFLRQVKEKTILCFENQDYSYEELVEALKITRNSNRNPLFDVIFVFQNFGEEVLSIPGFKLYPHQYTHGVAKFDLTLAARELGDSLSISINYSTELFREETIKRLIVYFNCILNAVITDPTARLSTIDILSHEERERLLSNFSSTSKETRIEKTIMDLFEEQVAETPNHVAVVFEGDNLTYHALDELSNALAFALQRTQITAGPVAIYLYPSLHTVVGIIGVLKSGRAFLPLDPEYTSGRYEEILRESGCSTLITDVRSNNLEFSGVKIILDDILKGETERKVDKVNKPGDLAYVMYTSGSTGKAKGVKVAHCNVVNYATWFRHFAKLSPKDRSVLTSSFAFDLGYTSIFPILLTGGELHLISSTTYRSPDRLLEYIKDNDITYIKITPSLFSTFWMAGKHSIYDPSALKYIVLGGEPVNPIDIRKVVQHRPDIRFVIHYGPTETTIGSIARYVDADSLEDFVNAPSIGRPIRNTLCYILGKDNLLVPVGCVGEICIGGDGVSIGYLGDDTLTREKFVDDPFQSGHKMYKTGDLARWHADGNVEFIGRQDDQVKVRGFRVVLREIESVLKEKVQDAVVMLDKQGEGDRKLVAYVVLRGETMSSLQLRKFLKGRLPEYMIPSNIIFVDRIPLTPNGKVDVRSLNVQSLPSLNTEENEDTAPKTEVEKQLARIWKEAIGVEHIRLMDTFFDLGGYSLALIGSIQKITEVFKVELPIDLYFNYSLEQIAREIDKSITKNGGPVH